MDWFFNGLGTEIIGVLITCIIGTAGYYVFVYKRTIKQEQIAGDNSDQRQEYQIVDNDDEKNTALMSDNLEQYQKAGNGSTQTQIGGTHVRQGTAAANKR